MSFVVQRGMIAGAGAGLVASAPNPLIGATLGAGVGVAASLVEAPPVLVSAPSIDNTLYAGGSIAMTDAVWAGSTSQVRDVLVNGVVVVDDASKATVEAYVLLLAQEGLSCVVRSIATGPGGTTSADSAGVTILAFPLTSLIGRYELDLCTLSGANVTALTDRSAQANDLTIGGAGAEVTLEADADYGGRLVGVFAAGKTLTRATFVGGAIAQPTTILWLGEFATLPAASYAYDGPTTRQGFYQASGGGFVFAGASMGAGTLSTATVYPMLTIHNGVSSDHYRGSSWAAPAFTGNPGANAMNGIRLGARDSGAAQMTGRIAIAAVWAKALDATERGQVAAYLNAKYGQAITT